MQNFLSNNITNLILNDDNSKINYSENNLHNNLTSNQAMSNIDNLAKSNFTLLFIFNIFALSFVIAHLVYFLTMIIAVYIRNKNIEKNSEKFNVRKLNNECSICLDNLNDETQLVCSHSFCAACIVDYGKHKFNMMNILCPVCRAETPRLIPQFQRTGDNKAVFDSIKAYNDEGEGRYDTSYILIVDIIKFLKVYIKKLLNTNDHRYNSHRSVIIGLACLSTVAIIAFCIPQSFTSVLGDMCYYYILIVLVRNMFRGQNNNIQQDEPNNFNEENNLENENRSVNNQEIDDYGIDNDAVNNQREDPRNLI